MMGQTDVAPSRLERAKQKISDLLARARRARAPGLIAYAGTAHLVMPLTDDRAVIEPFLAALTPDLMPSDGQERHSRPSRWRRSRSRPNPWPAPSWSSATTSESVRGALIRQAAGETTS